MLLTSLLASISACGDDAPAAAGLNGCADALFVDRTATGADRTVTFGAGSTPFAYTPKCITVAAGQTVTFTGNFSVHPIAPGTSPDAPNAGTAGNPIPRRAADGTAQVTFPAAGTYPYYCVIHYGGGMVGAVRVR